MAEEEYITLDNGVNAFIVTLQSNVATIKRYNHNETVNTQFIRSFIGTDLTRPDRPGNSILLQLNDVEYMYIGEKVKKFTLESQVVSYYSPIGNSNVPYPWCVCQNGDIVLLIENVIASPQNNVITNSTYDPHIDAYACYYTNHFIIQHTWSSNGNWSAIATGYKNIAKFYIGTGSYNLHYQPFPAIEWDRYQSFEDDEVNKHGISIEYVDGTRRQLTKNEYCELIEEFGLAKKFLPLHTVTLIERQW